MNLKKYIGIVYKDIFLIYERKLKWCDSVNDSLIALKSIY